MCVIPVVFCTTVSSYVNTYSRTQLYFFLLQGVYNNDMFRPYMWAIKLWLDSLGYTSMRVVVMGCNGAGSRSHYNNIYLTAIGFSPGGSRF